MIQKIFWEQQAPSIPAKWWYNNFHVPWEVSTIRALWGQLLLAIQTSGWEAFQTIIIRKLLMNLRLTTETPLAFILILTLLTIPVLYFHPPEFIKGLISRYPKVMAGFAGLSITAWVGFLVNDSGIASVALIFMFGTGMMALMIDDATASKKCSGKRPV